MSPVNGCDGELLLLVEIVNKRTDGRTPVQAGLSTSLCDGLTDNTRKMQCVNLEHLVDVFS